MRYTPILLISLLALQSCSLHDRLDSAASDLEQQYAELRLWDNLPLRTISWNQAVSMMKRSNASFTRARMSIEKAERSELSVYTDLIPGVSYYSYFNRSISDLTKAVNSDDITHNVNISFSIPTLTQVPYRVYASQARTYSAIKALEGKERELIAELYTLQRTLALESRIEQHNQKKPEQNKQPASPLNKTASQHSQWLKMATLLGDYSARWRILPSSIPQFKWSDYRKRTGQLDQLIICQLAMELEASRLQQYQVALNYLPTINTSIYSPSLFSSTGGTYTGTFLDMDDTKLNLSLSYSLDSKLNTWNNYQNSKAEYKLKQKEISARLIDFKQKLATLRSSMDEYYAWRSYMHKRIEHLTDAPASNAAEFLDNETNLHAMKQELLNQEKAAIESEAALILQYGLL